MYAADPPGNNGFIKIEDENIDEIPQNDPHVGCVFNVEFYNYDQGPYTATGTFETQEPTDGAVVATGSPTPFIGEDAAGGGKDLAHAKRTRSPSPAPRIRSRASTSS